MPPQQEDKVVAGKPENNHLKMVKDRTSEFKATVESLTASGNRIVNGAATRNYNTQPNMQYSEFMALAGSISKHLTEACEQLEQLAKMTRSGGLFGQKRAGEYVELAARTEASIQSINSDLARLRMLQANQPERQHSNGVVVSLQTRLADLTKQLAGTLQERERMEQEQRRRREQYSADIALPENLSLGLNNRRFGERSPLLNNSDTQDQKPRLDYQQLSLVQSVDTSYTQARHAAVEGIERSLHEIGNIFQQLTHMIAEQGETVQRIDANIEDVGMNIERGHRELIKYYNYVSSNRWLLLKMFTILIVFMILFNVFFL